MRVLILLIIVAGAVYITVGGKGGSLIAHGKNILGFLQVEDERFGGKEKRDQSVTSLIIEPLGTERILAASFYCDGARFNHR
jgi:hypothetical protein